MLYVAAGALLGGVSVQTAYFGMMPSSLAATIPIFVLLPRALPAVDRRTALYAALLFGVMSYTLGRGENPNKTNLYYSSILLSFIASIMITYRVRNHKYWKESWVIIGLLLSAGLVGGHVYSTGVSLLLMAVTATVLNLHPAVRRRLGISRRLSIYGALLLMVTFLGHAIITGRFLPRIVSLYLSLINIGGGATQTGGRFATLALDTLIINTASQFILLMLVGFGGVLALQHGQWEYDLALVWVGVGAVLIGMSIFINSADIPTQRIYSLLGLFGFNVLAAVSLRQFISDWNTQKTSISIAILIGIFAALALASPVADFSTAPAYDQPHYPRHTTAQHEAGQSWIGEHTTEASLVMDPPGSEVPIERTGPRTGKINLTVVESGTPYLYTTLANETGISIGSGGAAIGSGNYVFVPPPEPEAIESDDKIYSNGGTTVWIRR